MEVDVLSPTGEFNNDMLRDLMIGVSESYLVDPETGYHWDAYSDGNGNAAGLPSASDFNRSTSAYWSRNNQIPATLTDKLRMGFCGAPANGASSNHVGPGSVTKTVLGSPAGTDTSYATSGGNLGFSVDANLVSTICISMDGTQGIGWVAVVAGETSVTFRPPVPPYWEGWHGDVSGYQINTQTQTRFDWSYPSASYVLSPQNGDPRNRCYPISHNTGPYLGPQGSTVSAGTVSDYIANGNKAFPFIAFSLQNATGDDRAIQFRIRGSNEHPNRWPTPVGYNINRG